MFVSPIIRKDNDSFQILFFHYKVQNNYIDKIYKILPEKF